MAKPERLRTLHINTARGWRGGEQQSFHLMQGLIERGHAADAVCQPEEEFAKRAKDAGIPTIEIRMRGEWDLWAARRVGRAMERGAYDICHAHTAHAHMVAVAGRWFAPAKPALIVSRRVDFSLHKAPFGLSKLKYMLGVDRFVTVSDCIRQVMVADGLEGSRIAVVHSCQDPARFENVQAGALKEELGIAPSAPVLGNVSALVGHKGQRHLLDAMPKMLEEMPNLVLVIVGEGALRGALTAQARGLGIEGHVVFAGHRDDILRFYRIFDVFAMSSEMEGMGSAILEAMGMGCPVVATNAGGIPEVVRHERNGLLVERRNPGALANGVLRMLRDAELRRRCVEGGQRTLREEFSVDTLVENTLAVYRDVLAKRAASGG